MKDQNEQRKLSEINRPMNEELFNNLEKQYQELAKVKDESEQIEKQAIEEMGKLCPFYREGKCNLLESARCDFNCDMCDFAEALYNAGYRKQSEGEWVKDAPHWNYHCNRCGFYPHEMLSCFYLFCPNCGAKMKGGAE